MILNKIKTKLTLFKTIGVSESDDIVDNNVSQQPKRIITFFFVALAIRKFQKNESNSFIKSLNHYFDRRVAVEELKRLYTADRQFFQKHFGKLAYLIRKFELTYDDLGCRCAQLIFQYLRKHLTDGKNGSSDQSKLNFLCLSLKFLTENSSNKKNPLKLKSIIKLLETGHAKGSIKNSLVSLLRVCYDKQYDKDTTTNVLPLILNLSNLDTDTRMYFLGLSEGQKTIDYEENEKLATPMTKAKVKKNKMAISKTVQTVKSKKEKNTSEEANFEFVNLYESMKIRNKRKNFNTEKLDLFESKSESGNDRSIFRTTWGETVNLYSLVSSNKILKDNDKDYYLPEKLFGDHVFEVDVLFWVKKTNEARKVYSFFIHRMCTSVFFKISKNQILNDKAINKLMKCITDFNSLLSILNLDNNFVEMFANVTYERYWEVKNLKNPDIAVNFFQKCMSITTEEYRQTGWFYSSDKVRKKSYNRILLEKLIIDEINTLRSDAVKAIYNQAIRNKKKVLTKQRLSIIQKYMKIQDKPIYINPTLDNFNVKLTELAEELKDFDYQSTFEQYVEKLKTDLESLPTAILDSILKFMNNQARDLNRCQQLFSQDVLQILISCLSYLNDDNQLNILEIVNIILDHESTKELNDKNCKRLTDYGLKSKNTKIVKSCLTSILLTTNKTRSITEYILDKLMQLFCSMNYDEDYTNFIIFILSRVFCNSSSNDDSNETNNLFINNSYFVELISGKLSCDHSVKLNADDSEERVTFEQRSDNCHSSSNHISVLSARIILESIRSKVNINSITIENIFMVLMEKHNNENKQTKIIAAKCLYELTKYTKFPHEDCLNQLLNLINDEIYDVSVYSQLAYSKECLKVANAPLPRHLSSLHLENVSACYVSDSLKIGKIDYTEEINRNFFQILLYEARKNRKFDDENIFILFNSILNLNEKYVTDVLNILNVYTVNYIVPEIIVSTLENLLSVSKFFEESLKVLQNIILSGFLPVTKKTLCVLTNYLYSNSSRLRIYSFKLLLRADKNQELPDEVFYQLELARAGYALQSCHRTDNEPTLIIEYIQKLIDRGAKLPTDTTNVLELEYNNPDVLKIFESISKKKQIISERLLKILSEIFNPNEKSVEAETRILIKIFENSAKNNQKIETELMKKLTRALFMVNLRSIVLPIFIYLVQKGEHLSYSVNNKLLDELLAEKDPVLKQELLSSLGSLIQANKKNIHRYQFKIHEILTKEISSYNYNIQRLCVGSIEKFAISVEKLDKKLLSALIRVGTNPNIKKAINSKIQELFRSVLKNHHNPCIREMKRKIYLANLTYNNNSIDTFLKKLRQYINVNGGFFTQNYRKLQNIFDKENLQYREKIVNLLLECKSLERITDELLNSVAVSYQSTNSENLKNLCGKLLIKVAENGRNLIDQAKQIYISIANRKEYDKKFFESRIYNDLIRFVNAEIISELMEFIENNNEKLNKLNSSLNDFVNLIVEENSDFPKIKSFVRLIEECLLNGKYLKIILPYYCRIVKETKICNLKCLETIREYLKDHEQDENLKVLFFEIMFTTRKFQVLPLICMEFIMDNIESDNNFIRAYSFGILKAAIADKETEYAKILAIICLKLTENIYEFSGGLDIRQFECNLDLFECIYSLNNVNFQVFLLKENNIWKRELLVSDLFESMKASYSDQLHFYSNWLSIEEALNYEKSYEILYLIHKCKFHNFSQLIQLIEIIKRLNFKMIIRLLSNHSPNPLKAVNEEWITLKLRSSLSKMNINEKYTKKLAENLYRKFNNKFINKLFRCLKKIDNLNEFENFINFCLKEKIDLENISIENENEKYELNDLRNAIEAKCLFKCENEIFDKKFQNIFNQLKLNEWNFYQLRQIIKSFKLFCRRHYGNYDKNLFNFLNTLLSYDLPSSYFELIKTEILSKTETFPEILQKLNKLSIQNCFQMEGKEKNLNELLAELLQLNQNEKYLQKFIQSGSLDVHKYIFKEHSDKFNWTEKQIQFWARNIRKNINKFTNYEAIAIIYRANYLVTGHRLTKTQILSSLVALQNRGNQKSGKKLLQVATGEGKSTIICILAIINALRGRKVDVLTSSPVLAERDAKQNANLYRMFNLSCSHNKDNSVYIKGEKTCYSADIVYGEMSQFQFDLLRNNYSKLNTLGGRPLETAIVDEVDSMLIDDSSKIARLSSKMPGMDNFQPIYVFIWQYLNLFKERLIVLNEKIYFIDGKINFENDRITLEIIADDENENIYKIDDLESFILENGDETEFTKLIDDVDEYLSKQLNVYLDKQIESSKIYIPCHLREYVEKQKIKWIRNAVEALNYQENIHYVVHDGEIRPVDYISTGIIQSSTSWSDGLHQFLQLKHNLKMTSETRTTNFLSNVGFIKKYKQMYGLTGTLGSETARNVLKNVYEVDLINIPQRREKQFKELSYVIAEGDVNWLNEIIDNVLVEVKKNRGILVICETIRHANRISSMLKRKLRPSSVKLYVMNDMDQEENIEKISSGEVIVATNLAGRGTDIQTDKIEETGGLHVILTFLPDNQRVEDQAFGRTARQGKRGTGIMILNSHSLIINGIKEGYNPKLERDKLESTQLRKFIGKELKIIEMKDKLFDKFCKFLNDIIRVEVRCKFDSSFKKTFNYITDTADPSTAEICMLSGVEEQWASFLAKIDEEIIQIENAEEQYTILIDQLSEDLRNMDLIKNPFYYITIANDILVNNWNYMIGLSYDVERALEYFNKAVDLENKYWKSRKENLKSSTDDDDDKIDEMEDNSIIFSPGAAHFGIAWCLILLRNDENYKENALKSLKIAIKCLSNEMSILNATQLLLQQTQIGYSNSDLDKQLNIKITILGSYMNGIKSCIDSIKRSKRFINFTSTEFHNTKKKKNDDCSETRTYENDKERKDIENLLDEKHKYSIVFNHLTRRYDCGEIDQALETLKNAFELTETSIYEKCLEKVKTVKINLNQIDLSVIHKELFNRNKEFKCLTRESALKCLTEERSYLHAFRLGESSMADLQIHSNNEKKKVTYENRQINDLIEIIDGKNSHDSLRFDIKIKDANVNDINIFYDSKSSTNNNSKISIKKKTKTTTTTTTTFELNITFDNLNSKDALEKLNSIKSELFDIKFVAKKLALLKLIEKNDKLKFGALIREENNNNNNNFNDDINDNNKVLMEKFDRKKLLIELKKLKSDETPCCIQFENLNVNLIRNVIECCCCSETVAFLICFKNVSSYIECDVEQCRPVNLSFDNINLKSAEIIIKLLREKNLEFSLEFDDLSDKNVRHILRYANLDEEHLEITKRKNIKDIYMTNSMPIIELNEFISKGVEFIIIINEKQFIPWRSICAVAALGTGQVILGGILMMTGFGTSTGIAVVTEGFTDLIQAARVCYTREFQWSSYCTQKAISLAISAVSMGISSMKNAVKGVETITTGVGKEMLEQSGTGIIVNRKSILETVKKTGANLKSLTRKFIAVKATEEVSKEMLNTGIHQFSNIAFENLKPSIRESVESHILRSFNNPNLKCLLYKMYAIDLATESNQLQSKIEQFASDIIRQDTMTNVWNSIGQSLIKGILSSYYGSAISIAIRVGGTLNGLKQVVTLTESLADKLLQKLKQENNNFLRISMILRKHLKINKNNSEIIANELKSHRIFDKFDSFSSDNDLKNKINNFKEFKPMNLIGKSESIENDIRLTFDFVQKFHEKFENANMDSLNTIVASLSDIISEQLIHIMDSQMLQPWSSLAVSGFVDSISKDIQHFCLVDEKQNSDSQNNDKDKYKKLSNKKKLSEDEKEFLVNYKKRNTFQRQLDYNSKDYCIAYSQCEIVSGAKQKNSCNNNSATEIVTKRATDIREGTAPNLAEMVIAAEKNNINMKLVDSRDYQLTFDDIHNNVQVIYIEYGENNEIGHAYYMNNDTGKMVDASPISRGNDCFFIALSEILEKKEGVRKSYKVIRAETAESILSNSKSFSQIIKAETWVKNNHSDSFNSILMTAGLHKDKKTGRILLDENDIEDLIVSIKDSNRGGTKHGKKLKEVVPPAEYNGKRPDKNDESCHHLEPNQDIEYMVKGDYVRETHPEMYKSGEPSRQQINNVIDKAYEKIKENKNLKQISSKSRLWKDVENHLNHPNNEPLFRDKFDEDGKLNKNNKKIPGRIIHSSFSWFPNNLVKGPKKELRKKDPENKRDTELIRTLPPENQKRHTEFAKNPNIRTFTRLPPSSKATGVWSKDEQGKYRYTQKEKKRR